MKNVKIVYIIFCLLIVAAFTGCQKNSASSNTDIISSLSEKEDKKTNTESQPSIEEFSKPKENSIDKSNETFSLEVYEISENSAFQTDDNEHIVDAYQYYTSKRVYDDIDLLCEKYHDIITQTTIGKSTNNKPIVCITLGKGCKKGCIVSGIHSREHITISFTMRCIEEYADAYKNTGKYGEYDVRKLLNDYTLYIIPMCNPDGTDISNAKEKPLVDLGNFDPDEYKLNANGVNLNRNFPFNWKEEFSQSDILLGDEIYPGINEGSEKETQAIIKLCDDNQFEWLLDMHILGNGIYWRDEKNGIIENDIYFTESIAKRCGYQIFEISTVSRSYSGGLENWFRYAYKKPSLCIELLPYSQTYYTSGYRNYNNYFEQVLNWEQTKYTYLEAMNCM